MVEEGSVEAEVRLVCAADTVIADGLMTWLDKVAMVPSVVIGVTRDALELSTVPPARLVETVPVTVPRVVTPRKTWHSSHKAKRPWYMWIKINVNDIIS